MNENNYTICLQYTTGVSNISGSHRMANLLIEMSNGHVHPLLFILIPRAASNIQCRSTALQCLTLTLFNTRQWAGKWNKSLAHENWSKNSLKKYPRDWSHSSCIKSRVWKMLSQRWVVKKAWNLLHSCSECVRKKSKMADLCWLSPRSLLHWVTWNWGHKFHFQHGIHFAGQSYDTSMIWIESPLVYISYLRYRNYDEAF